MLGRAMFFNRAEPCDKLRFDVTLLCGQSRKEQQRVNYTLFPLGGGYRFNVAAPVKTVYGQHTLQVKELLHSFA